MAAANALEILKTCSKKERLDVLWQVIQDKKDEPYYDYKYRFSPRFGKGEIGLVLSDLYYKCEVREVSEEDCSAVKKKVPCYRVRYVGWTEEEEDRKWVNEYDLCKLNLDDAEHFAVQELLFAHYWNVFEVTTKAGKKRSKVGMFRLESEQLDKLEGAWRTLAGVNAETTNWTFKKWMGFS